MNSINIPSQIVIKLVMCVMVLGLIVLAAIMPQRHDIDQKRSALAEGNAALQQHDALSPSYAKMKAALDKGLPQGLPPQREVHLTQDDITEISGIMRDLAADQGVLATAIVPDPSSIAGLGNAVSVDCTFRGSFEAQRALLLQLGSLSCLSHIEQVSVHEDQTRSNMQLKAWLTLE